MAAVGGIGNGNGDAIAVPPPTPWRPESIPKAITSYDDSSKLLKMKRKKGIRFKKYSEVLGACKVKIFRIANPGKNTTRSQNQLWSRFGKLFFTSSPDVPAQLPSAMLPRQARGTCKKTVYQTYSTVDFGT